MPLVKTDLARAALTHHGTTLRPHDRHVLILCDGRRSAQDIAALLGGKALLTIDWLRRAGYLCTEDGSGAPAAQQATVRTRDARDIRQPVASPEHIAAASPASTARKSAVAAKLYMLDMLQLQRDADTEQVVAALRASREPDEITQQIETALRHLRGVAASSYCARVAARLADILPADAFAPAGSTA